MSDIDDMRGLTALKAIQRDIIDPVSRSKVISIIQPYTESMFPKSGDLSKEIWTQELSWVSIERAEIFEKIAKKSNNLDYSDIEYASVVIKHTFLLANLSSDGKVLDELQRLIHNFLASAPQPLPTEEEVKITVNNALKDLKSEHMDLATEDFIKMQSLFIFDKDLKTEFSDGLTKLQLHFVLEVLFAGMVDFYCQQVTSVKGLAPIFTLLNFADKENGANLWGYTYVQANNRLNLIVDWSKKHQEILDTMRLGAKIFGERFVSDSTFSPLGITYYLKLPENENILNFFKKVNFN